MNAAELRKELKSRPVGTVNFTGREDLLKREARDVLVKALVAKGTEAFNVRVIRADRPTEDDLLEMREPPFDSLKRVVLLMGGGDPAEALRQRGPDTVLISWQGKLGFPDLTVECMRMSGGRLRTWLRGRARGLNADLDQDDAEKLITAFGTGAEVLDQQLQKLALLDHVEGSHVEALCATAGGAEVWEAVDALFREDKPATALAVHELLSSGTAALILVAALQRRCRQLLAVESGVEVRGVPDWEAARLNKSKGRIPWDRLLLLLDRLVVLEWRVKQGAGPEEFLASVVMLAGGKW